MKHRMRNRMICGIILSSGALCLGASFSWSGSGTGDDWDTCGNWDACSGARGYPQAGDDATIDGTYDVDLVTVTIDDLTVTGIVTLGDADSDDPTLTLDSLTVTGDSTVELTEGSTVVTG